MDISGNFDYFASNIVQYVNFFAAKKKKKMELKNISKFLNCSRKMNFQPFLG